MKKLYSLLDQDHNTISTQLQIATNPFTKMKGLLGRRMMGEEEALLFFQASSIHTFGMKFAIDIVFLNRQFEIVRIVEALPAGKMAYCSSYVTIELPAYRTKQKLLSNGNTLRWFLNEESGQILVEYALILALLIVGVLIAFIPLLESVQNFMNQMINFVVDL